MTIMKDAEELLIYIYQEYLNNNPSVESAKIAELTNWDSGRINRAKDFLQDLKAIKVHGYMGNTSGVHNFIITGMTPIGISMIEDKEKFKRHFNHEVDLKIYKFSWGATEK